MISFNKCSPREKPPLWNTTFLVDLAKENTVLRPWNGSVLTWFVRVVRSVIIVQIGANWSSHLTSDYCISQNGTILSSWWMMLRIQIGTFLMSSILMQYFESKAFFSTQLLIWEMILNWRNCFTDSLLVYPVFGSVVCGLHVVRSPTSWSTTWCLIDWVCC